MLKDQISADLKASMRAKNALRLGAIRLLLAAIKQKEIDERSELDDMAVVAIVDRLIKQRQDSAAAFTQAGRLDLAEQENAEAALLRAYLPDRLNAETVDTQVREMVAELGVSGAADMGRVMTAAKKRFAGQAEMSQVSAAVKRALAR